MLDSAQLQSVIMCACINMLGVVLSVCLLHLGPGPGIYRRDGSLQRLNDCWVWGCYIYSSLTPGNAERLSWVFR